MTDRANYPAGWKAVSYRIRMIRAGGRCECEGECGLHRTHPGPRRCTERHGEPAQWARGKVILTTAHLNGPDGPFRCDPLCIEEAHLKAMCHRCHLRYDVVLHARHARENRRQGAARGDLFDEMSEGS